MRICIVYDCLYPHTRGGAEHWYRDLAEALRTSGHEITYLTLRQWKKNEEATLDEPFQVVGVGRKSRRKRGLYTRSGRHRILPPLIFNVGVFWHLLRHGRRYQTVHVCAFPYSSLLIASLLRRRSGYRLVVDWFEVWSRDYWRDYLGGVRGWLGARVQRACITMPTPDRVFCFSQMHAERLRDEGLRESPTILSGLYAGPTVAAGPVLADPLVLFAGRLIPEKRATVGVEAVALAAARIPGLQAIFYGEGPEHEPLVQAIARHGVKEIASAPGWAESNVLDADQRRALCMLAPSRREGYGLVVVEAAARATPSVVVEGKDNAATELVSEGVNGMVAASEDPQAIADAIVRVHKAGLRLRETTAHWFAENADRLSLESSLQQVLASYGRDDDSARA